MKRFHVHVAVPSLDKGIRFYSTMFGSEPSIVKPDYAKWMLEDPRVNFAISERGGAAGVNHLGFQVEDGAELIRMRSQLARADAAVVEEKDVSCCYARSDKYWITDPAGVAWETFHSLGTVPYYDGEENACGGADTACCAVESKPAAAGKAACCS
jgi:catechol 2,3-dioxygenase-like lactoylglutathione lyase family enzyme